MSNDLARFVEMVRMMRVAQRRYFSSQPRRSDFLREAKRLERVVDDMMTEALRQSKWDPTLFDPSPPATAGNGGAA